MKRNRNPNLQMYIVLTIILGLWFQGITYAQELSDSGKLTLERIFSGREFMSERFGPAQWLNDASGYTTIEYTGGRQNLVKYQPGQSVGKVLVSGDQLIPEGKEEPLRIESYSWSPDGNRLLIYTNSKRVWRQNTRGDYWILDLNSGQLKQLGTFAEPSTLMFAKFSPDGTRVGYVVKNDLYVEDLNSGKIIRLTHDGSRTIINGTFDWVYEEEFSLRDGFRWSPDGSRIAYWQLDASGVRDFYLINNTDALYSFIIPVQYPKVGERLSACRVGVVPATGGETVWMKLEGDPRNNYIPRMDWAGNSGEILMQYMPRRQNTIHLMLGDALTGKVREIFTEKDDAWLDPIDDVVWLGNGKEFTWVSERSGWRHIYRISRDGTKVTPVTQGDYDVINILKIDEQKGTVYFIASPDNPGQRYLFRMALSGRGRAVRVTPEEEPGIHGYQISPDAKWAIHTFTNSRTARQVDMIKLPDHKQVRMLVDNKNLQAKLDALNVRDPEFFKIDIDGGVRLDGWMIKPPDFDPAKKYPVLFNVYGEPAGQTVMDRPPSLWHLYLSQQGYIIMSVDNRGTPAPRGRAWRKSIFRKIGILNAADQAAAARVIRTWPFVDSSRIGIWGWSGGGSSTLNALLQYPELYQTGISVAPVPDQRLYDAIYQERYMLTPEKNPEGFREGSPITHAKNLKGNLLLVHGTGDDNVHFQGSERLINEFIKYNRQFTLMIYPNRSHGIYEGEGTRMHLYTLMTNFLLEKLPPGGR